MSDDPLDRALDPEYQREQLEQRRVEETWVGDIWVSTIRIPYIDLVPGTAEMLGGAYETMLFHKDEAQEDWPTWRWPTEKAARRGHRVIVEELERGGHPG